MQKVKRPKCDGGRAGGGKLPMCIFLHSPRRTIGGLEKRTGGEVALNGFGDGVPMNRPPCLNRDVADVANARAAVPGFDGGTSGLAGANAVKPISPVIVAAIDVLLAGADDVLENFRVGGLQRTPAVHVKPFSIFAVKLCAGRNFSADRDNKAVRVGAFIAVAAFGIIRGTGFRGGEEDIFGFDFHGAGVVAAHGPMGNVEVVAYPVHQVTAAEIEHPAPIVVRDVGVKLLILRRAEPHLVVEVSRRFTEGTAGTAAFGAPEIAAGANLNMGNFADAPVAHKLHDAAKIGEGALPASGLPDNTVLLDGVHDGASFGEGVPQRFLAPDVYPGTSSGDSHDAMPVVGRGKNHGVEIRFGKHLTEVLIARGHLTLVLSVDAPDETLQPTGVGIAAGYDLHIVEVATAQIVGTLSCADDAERDSITGGNEAVAPKCAGRDDCGKKRTSGERGDGVFQEAAARRRGGGAGNICHDVGARSVRLSKFLCFEDREEKRQPDIAEAIRHY